MGPVLFSIFVNDLGDGTECTFRKFAEWGEVVDIPDAAIQRDLDMLVK